MKTLVIDTETTGLPDFNKRASDPSQPHIVQFAALVLDNDNKETHAFCSIVRPDGWSIPAEASAVHGITDEVAREKGIAESTVAMMFLSMMEKASVLVAHNLQFDKFIMRVACRRHGFMTDEMDQWWKAFPTFCTMRASTNICKIPQANGYGYKWPKLKEAASLLLKEKVQEGHHDALEDVRACARLYRHLVNSKPAEDATRCR